ncbi:MAG: Spo0B domain-containing protein [Peptococcaceae bacterium]|jgi:sensor histidine kinase regulating citrate/malate metabolism|nr:Spo0B domain-containing protein [Peptococcaceae bacterium]
MSDLELTLLTEQLHWYKLQRHDFMNHWQVMMGYLQLKQNEKALAYMHEVINGLTVEQKISQLAQPIVAACLLGWVIRMRLESVDVHLGYPGEMKDDVYWQENWRKKYAERFYAFTTECLQEARVKAQKYKEHMAAEITLKNRNGIFHCEMMLTCRGIVLMKKTLGMSENVRL